MNMLDKKQAYSILGLREDATDDEVEQRYTVLLLRSKHRNAGDASPDKPAMSDITQAYKFIKGAAIEEEVRQNEPKNKTIGRIGHFWHYYRWHVIGSITAVILIFFLITSIMDSRNEEKRIARADLKVVFLTEYNIPEVDVFEEKLLEKMQDWKDVYVTAQYSPIEPKDEYGAAMMQKVVISMASDEQDVYIVDDANLEKFGKQDVFLNLGEIPALAGVAQNKRAAVTTEEAGEIWAGIEISGSSALTGLNLPEDMELYAVIRVDADKLDNAVKALEWLKENQVGGK